MDLPKVEVAFEGTTHVIDVSDMDALEWGALRAETGLLARDVMVALQKLDPFAIAGLLWIVLRRADPELDFRVLASRVSLTTLLDPPSGDAAPPAAAGS